MNSRGIVKNELLRRKVQEYFSKNPKKKSVVVSLGEGDSKLTWKATKDKGSFKVVEVKTSCQEFILEQPLPVGGQAPAPTTQAQPGMAPQGAGAAQSHNIEAYKGQDFNSKIQMLGSVVPLNIDTISMAFADLLKPGSGQQVALLRQTIEQGSAAVTDPSQKQGLGSALGFLTVLGNQRELMSHKSNKGPVVAEKKKLTEQPGDETPEEPNDPVGSEQQPTLDTPPGEGDAQVVGDRPEEALVSQALQGHTIKNAHIDVGPTGGSLTLDLITTENPATLEWQNTGRVVFNYKGRKHLIQNG